jgi:hypothetical protein
MRRLQFCFIITHCKMFAIPGSKLFSCRGTPKTQRQESVSLGNVLLCEFEFFFQLPFSKLSCGKHRAPWDNVLRHIFFASKVAFVGAAKTAGGLVDWEGTVTVTLTLTLTLTLDPILTVTMQ